jgi:adenine-specific DNA methylase
MIPRECKRLAEVDFPIAVVSKHAAREKSIRHGHPSTLHLWWARRPLAACRAMLLGLLLPDPCDEHCPEEFKQKSRELLPKVQGQVGPNDEDLRKSLLKFIGDFANWDLSSDRTYLEVSRGLVKAAHPEETPLVVDPFAGGGSIPLEALRLGCEAFASDLNPVACLILKVMLEDIPRRGPKLAEELRRVGAEIKKQAEKELADLYPKDPDGATPIAYLWARTVRCESPDCGAEIPLLRSFWLCKKANHTRALRFRVKRQKEKGKSPEIEFEIFEPKSDREVRSGTVTRAKASCLACNMVLGPERVRAQLGVQRGGVEAVLNDKGERTAGARLVAVVLVKPGDPGRHYRLPTKRDYQSVCQAQVEIAKTLEKWAHSGEETLCPVPDEPIDEWHHDVNRMPMYGMRTWGDLFTARQKVTLVTLTNLVRKQSTSNDGDLCEALAILVNRNADRLSTVCRWNLPGQKVEGTFSRQALPIVWDFAEVNPLSDSTGGYDGALAWIVKVIEIWPASGFTQPQPADATSYPLPDEAVAVWFTDPPYYDAIDYAHCADFFFVWLKRTLPGNTLLRDSSDPKNPLTPKALEIVVDSTTTKGHGSRTPEFYEKSMGTAFAEGRRVLSGDGIGSVVFAHKTTEGWEALLSGMIRGGWTITGSWPIATEMGSRLRARESAALATSVHLICRPRPDNALIGEWAEVHRELPKRVAEWMERLQSEHIRGADLVFACIGPALEIYSRYSKVVDAEDREIPLGGDPEAAEPHRRGYLAYVWEAVGRAALEQVLGTAEAVARNGVAGALEEDARLTALFLWTLQSTNGEQSTGNGQQATGVEDDDEEEDAPKKKKKGLTLVFDVVRRFAQPLGIHLDTWEDRIIETEKGIVRLLPVGERGTQLFGQEGADLVAERLERSTSTTFQLTLFPDKTEAALKVKGKKAKAKKGSDKDLRTNLEATTLDRVHAAMLLQASGRTNGLRALVKAEQERGPDFLRLSNALSALYPKQSEEKRLLDAMLLSTPK